MYNYTWNTSAYGGSALIHASFPAFQWADQPVLRDTWKEMGIKVANECAGGDKEGICWVPLSQHPVTARRSHAGLGHYTAVLPRSNYDLLVNHQVTKVVYPNGLTSGPPLVQARSLTGSSVLINVTANAEVIISAGAMHTPTILQRSGIGPASFLSSAGIPLLLDLPGVGSNFQDHSGPPVTWNYTTPGNFSPIPSDMLNPAFKANATAAFDETPARGPYTQAGGNSAIFVSLPHMHPHHAGITGKIRAMVANGTAASYLPPDYASNPAMIAGYEAQLMALANLLDSPEAASLETPWATSMAPATAWSFLLHPLSRGTVRLDPTDHLSQPLVDYRAGSNPVDFDIQRAQVRYLRRLLDTPTMKSYGATEMVPGATVAASDSALTTYIKDQSILSFMHPCCTAAMMPQNKGGVVGPDLKVHGAPGLRIADMSIMPLIPGTHLSATAYAVGEKVRSF